MEARSVCKCGHGDDEHLPDWRSLAAGRGVCSREGCGCKKFTWRSFTPEFEAKIPKASIGEGVEDGS